MSRLCASCQCAVRSSSRRELCDRPPRRVDRPLRDDAVVHHGELAAGKGRAGRLLDGRGVELTEAGLAALGEVRVEREAAHADRVDQTDPRGDQCPAARRSEVEEQRRGAAAAVDLPDRAAAVGDEQPAVAVVVEEVQEGAGRGRGRGRRGGEGHQLDPGRALLDTGRDRVGRDLGAGARRRRGRDRLVGHQPGRGERAEACERGLHQEAAVQRPPRGGGLLGIVHEAITLPDLEYSLGPRRMASARVGQRTGQGREPDTARPRSCDGALSGRAVGSCRRWGVFLSSAREAARPSVRGKNARHKLKVLV